MSNQQIFTSFVELLTHNNVKLVLLNNAAHVTNSPPTNVHESVEGKSFAKLVNGVNGFRKDIEDDNRKQKEHPNATADLARSAATLKENRHDLLNDIKTALPEIFAEIKYAKENEPTRLPYLERDHSKFAKACEDVMKLDKELHNNTELQELLLKIPDLVAEINSQ